MIAIVHPLKLLLWRVFQVLLNCFHPRVYWRLVRPYLHKNLNYNYFCETRVHIFIWGWTQKTSSERQRKSERKSKWEKTRKWSLKNFILLFSFSISDYAKLAHVCYRRSSVFIHCSIHEVAELVYNFSSYTQEIFFI